MWGDVSGAVNRYRRTVHVSVQIVALKTKRIMNEGKTIFRVTNVLCMEFVTDAGRIR